MITFTAVGDCFITRCAPERDPNIAKLSEIIRKNDVRIANLEVAINDGSGYPSAICGGTWANAHPQVLKTIREYGFNGIGWANNHTLDYLHAGVVSTRHHLENLGFVHAGAGENLYEASCPKYIETVNGRVALISCSTTAPEDWIAGDQRKDGFGRPGLNLLRTQTIYTIPKQDLAVLKDIASTLHMNENLELLIENGFQPPYDPDIHIFGNIHFKEGDKRRQEVKINASDQQRLQVSIDQGRRSADYVLVSIHAHEMKDDKLEEPAKFLVELSHACIDNGADAVIGHGPHIVRGIEIYKKKPIFYSLGNFIYQPETVSSQPADMFEKFGLNCDHNVVDVFSKLNANAKQGHHEIFEMWQSVVPVWKMTDGELVEIILYPIELGFGLPNYRNGWPAVSEDVSVLQNLRDLSHSFKTDIELKDKIGVVRI